MEMIKERPNFALNQIAFKLNWMLPTREMDFAWMPALHLHMHLWGIFSHPFALKHANPTLFHLYWISGGR